MRLRVKSRPTKWRDVLKVNNPEKYELLKNIDAARQRVKYKAIEKITAVRQLNQDDQAVLKEKRESQQPRKDGTVKGRRMQSVLRIMQSMLRMQTRPWKQMACAAV